MSDLIERAEKAIEEYAMARKKYGNEIAKDVFASAARTLLPEAIEEIKRLEAKLAVAVEALEDALNRMEEDRASGDCGNWDWVDGDVYSRGRAALAEIKA